MYINYTSSSSTFMIGDINDIFLKIGVVPSINLHMHFLDKLGIDGRDLNVKGIEIKYPDKFLGIVLESNKNFNIEKYITKQGLFYPEKIEIKESKIKLYNYFNKLKNSKKKKIFLKLLNTISSDSIEHNVKERTMWDFAALFKMFILINEISYHQGKLINTISEEDIKKYIINIDKEKSIINQYHNLDFNYYDKISDKVMDTIYNISPVLITSYLEGYKPKESKYEKRYFYYNGKNN